MVFLICGNSPKGINFFLSAVIHSLILLIIISSFFFIYVSQLAKTRFQDDLKSAVDNLEPTLAKADKDQYIKNILKGMNLTQAEQYYSQASESTQLENSWLLKVTIGIIVMLILTVIIVVIITKVFCQNVPVLNILKENFILFFLIGLIEVYFFLTIAIHFVPVKPSLIMQTIVSTLQNNF